MDSIIDKRLTPAADLAAKLAAGLVVMPACWDALSVRIMRDAGFQASFLSGFCVAATRYGLPDTGLIAGAEMSETLRLICAANPGFPIIADGDTGYGNAMNVRHTVQEYARAGAAAIMLEDQLAPKRCGHMVGKEVTSLAEARQRIAAAADARREFGLDILILARTDARATLGFDAAMERCHAFAEAGADMLFLEAPRSEEELETFARTFNLPCLANMVPGGMTPMLPPSRLRDMGVRLALYFPLFAGVGAIQANLAALLDDKAEGPTPFSEVYRLAGAEEYFATEKRYKI
jgi:2-methylisocitrate lyase-like PEP mutase family enzyme